MNVKTLYNLFVTGKEKAVATALVTFLVTFVAQHLGYHTSDALQQTITSVVLALLAHQTTYWTSNTNKLKS